jgi:hypothetical protein
MTLTNKYYITALITVPTLAALIAFSTMPMLVSLLVGLVAQGGFTMAGYYLGKRENQK